MLEKLLNFLKFSKIHCYVLEANFSDIKKNENRSFDKYNIKEISESDVDEINQITDIDPWKVSKTITLEGLKSGQSCLVAKNKEEVVAYCWATTDQWQYNPHFNRKIIFEKNESYIFRLVTKQEYRKMGIGQNLLFRHFELMSEKYGKEKFIAIVKSDNTSSLRTFSNAGFKETGYTGYFIFFKTKIVYLFGKKSFKNVKNRLFFYKI